MLRNFHGLCCSPIYYGDEIKWDRMGWECGTQGIKDKLMYALLCSVLHRVCGGKGGIWG